MDKFNVAQFLRHAPKGLQLYCSVFNRYLSLNEVYTTDDGVTRISVDMNDGARVFFNEFGELYDPVRCRDVEGLVLFPCDRPLGWKYAAEVLFPQCERSVIIDGDGDALIVGSECYYYFITLSGQSHEVIDTCRFHKLNYADARFADEQETAEFMQKLSASDYVFDARGNLVCQSTGELNPTGISRHWKRVRDICKAAQSRFSGNLYHEEYVNAFRDGANWADDNPIETTFTAADRGTIDEIILALTTLGEEKMIDYSRELEFLNYIKKL